MKNGLYHRRVFWPEQMLSAFAGQTWRLRFSYHALEQCLADKYGKIVPPRELTVNTGQVFEMEIQNGRPVKLAFEIPHQGNLLTLVCSPDGFVRTLWLNRSGDKHQTLDKNRYQTP